jgi:protein-S-isoprenylcysteine O-methyltransferase Ste14
MALNVEFERSGSWLFRHRSFLAFAGLPLIAAGLASSTFLGGDRVVDRFWNAACFVVSFSGFALRVYAIGHAPKGTSGRNTRSQVAESLNTTGIYSVIRHPLYLGNCVMALGMVMIFHTWWIVALGMCFSLLLYERIAYAEEAFLRKRFGETFDRWAEVTPAVIPRLRLWKPSVLPFSWRTALRREYTGFFNITTAFALVVIASDFVAAHRPWREIVDGEWPWIGLAALGAVVYLVLRTLKKQTNLLQEEGR